MCAQIRHTVELSQVPTGPSVAARLRLADGRLGRPRHPSELKAASKTGLAAQSVARWTSSSRIGKIQKSANSKIGVDTAANGPK